jgi:hypothetical protein
MILVHRDVFGGYNIEFGYFLHKNYHLFDAYYCSKDSSELPAQVSTKYDWKKKE